MISLIVARARNGVIGSKNALPWYLPADLRRFRLLTTGHSVVMGRKTYDSIVARLGHGLPDRQNIVISRSVHESHEGVLFVSSFDEAIAAATSEEIFVIGGAQIYQQALPRADKLYITEVAADIAGDVFFPVLHEHDWREMSREQHHKDEKNPYDFAFVELVRR
ncbi:MAG TPA: dihydrofolate reductase [Candidatus Saccharimonadales bacterium]